MHTFPVRSRLNAFIKFIFYLKDAEKIKHLREELEKQKKKIEELEDKFEELGSSNKKAKD